MRRFFLWFWWLIFTLFIMGRIVAYTTEVWWYREQGQTGVYLTIVSTRLILFALGAALVVVVLGLNTRRAWCAEMQRRQQLRHELNRELHSQIYSVLDESPEETDTSQNLGLERLRRWAWRLGLGFFAFVGGAFASFNWPIWLRAFHAVATEKRDPIFGLDAGFYIFHLPALQFVWMFVFLLLAVTLIAVFLVYGHDNDFDLRGEAPAISSQALKHLSILLAAILIWKALGYRLDSYELLTTQQAAVVSESFTGIGYTDARVRLPALMFMSVFALGAAVMIWLCGRRDELRNVVWTIGIYLGTSVLFLVFLPGFTQALRVDPQGARLQSVYLKHHAEWTRWAYGLENVGNARSEKQSSTRFAFPTLKKPSDIKSAVSIWSEDELLKQLHRQVNTEFAVTNAAFGVRKINGEWRPVYIATRELSPIAVRQDFNFAPDSLVNRSGERNLEGNAWLSRHFRWTHGSGVVIADANRLRHDATDEPVIYNVSPRELPRPQIYFGEWQPPTRDLVLSRAAQEQSDSQVGASNVASNNLPADAMPRAINSNRLRAGTPVWQTLFNPDSDYVVLPNQPARTSSEYSTAGVEVRNRWRKFLLAWRFADPRFYFSPLINNDSRVVWHRRISDRCAALAPFIDWQNAKPRAVIYNGHIVWLLQGTTSSRYAPYSQQSRDGTNYHRASVIATVDAFNGETKFYITDSSDVLVRCYSRAFPRLFRSLNEMPRELQQQATYSQATLDSQARAWLHLRHLELTSENAKADTNTQKWEIGQPFQAALPSQNGDASTPVVVAGITLQPVGANQSAPQACLLATRNEDGKEKLWIWSPADKGERKTSAGQNSAETIYLPAANHWVRINIEREPKEASLLRVTPRRLTAITLNWKGHTSRATNLEDAVQLLDARMRNTTPVTPVMSQGQKWQRARELAQMMRSARQRRDWSAYGLAEKELMDLLNPTKQESEYSIEYSLSCFTIPKEN